MYSTNIIFNFSSYFLIVILTYNLFIILNAILRKISAFCFRNFNFDNIYLKEVIEQFQKISFKQ